MWMMPEFSAKSYFHNNEVEHAIADILGYLSNTTPQDFSLGARPEYDFMLFGNYESDYGVPFSGLAQIELKTTTKSTIPVEMYKDDEETIPAGITASTSPFIVVMSMAPGGNRAKLRAFKRSILLRSISANTRHFYPGKTPSQGSVQYHIPCTNENPPHLWLGDFDVVTEINGYTAVLSESFVPGFDGNKFTDWMREHVAKQKQVEMY